MDTHVLKMACCMAVAVTAGSASATHHFVSADKQWAMTNSTGQAMSGTKYNNLQTAVNAARAGDTVWVKDGFVWASGSQTISTTGGKSRIKPYNAAFTLRSESGYVDEANGKGATIRGEKTASTTGYDKNNVRPVWSQNAQTLIQGFILEDGGVGNSATYGLGGAIYGPGIVSNCVIRNCSAYAGGAFGSTTSSAKYITAYDTVISNCQALASKYGGGAVYGAGELHGCTLVGNSSACHGGALSNEDTKRTPTYSNCAFRDNTGETGTAGAYLGANVAATFSHCQFQDNATAAAGAAGGVSGKATLISCTFTGNRAADGAAAFSADTAENCYNCLFGGNTSASGCIVEGNASAPLYLYNCTVAGNSSPGTNCVFHAAFHNSVIWGNACGGNKELQGCTAEYSCQKDLTSGVGNINEDPKLTADFRLSKGSKCVDTAKYYDWMDAAGNPRAFDAAGYPRIRGISQTDALPDRGCYERECPGSLVIGR